MKLSEGGKKKTVERMEKMVVKEFAFPVKSALFSVRKMENVVCVKSK